MKSLVVFSFLVAHVLGKCELPPLPNVYQSSIQWNVNMVERLKSTQEVLDERGITVSWFETVDEPGVQAVVEFFFEFSKNVSLDKAIFLRDQIVWSPKLSGVKNFLDYLSIEGKQICTADQISDDSFFSIIFGFDPENPTFPSISHFLHFGDNMGYTCMDNQEFIDGIPTNVYTTQATFPGLKGDLNITYYWSDATAWAGTSGSNRSVPVQARLYGMIESEKSVKTVDIYLEFSNFFEVELDDTWFQPPSSIHCWNRTLNQKLPPLTAKSFTYNSEVIFELKIENGPEFTTYNIIMPQKEFYDQDMGVSRTDYKPLNIADRKVLSKHDIFSKSFVKDIKDFNAGVSYIINKETNNCTMRKIEYDLSGDVVVDEHGHIHMASPVDLWNWDLNFATNGLELSREIWMDSFVTAQQIDDTDEYLITALYLTTPEFAIEGDTDLLRNSPVKMEKYRMKYRGAEELKHRYNIIGLTESHPSWHSFDIGACFPGDKSSTNSVQFDWSENYDIDNNRQALESSFRAAIVKAARITTVRIENIQIDVIPKKKIMVLAATIVDAPDSGLMSDDAPDESKTTLTDALTNWEKAVKDKSFEVQVVLNDGHGSTTWIKAQRESFNSVDDQLDHDFKKIKHHGYSSGSMAALGIMMLIIVTGGTVALLKFVLKW